MTEVQVGLVSLVAICLLVYSGLHIAVALALCSFLGVWAIKENFHLAASLLGVSAADSIESYDLAVIPLFVLMGLIINSTSAPTDGFRVANQLLRRVNGGVGVATVFGNAILSAVTGVTIASVAIFTKLAVPQMLKLGYSPRMAVGIVAGSGVLGMMIPPSVLIIVFCLLTEVSVGKMFLGAVIPGLILTLGLAAGVIFMCSLWPAFAGNPHRAGTDDLMSVVQMARAVVPLALLILLTFGGIYGGIFTATEAGAVGALGALLIALFERSFTGAKLISVLKETGVSTSAICLLVIAANMYSRLIALSGLPQSFTGWLANAQLGLYGLIFFYVLLLLFLGTMLDSISTLLLSVPLLLPTFIAYNADLVWIGIITILATEMGIVTPPLGISAFVVKGSLEDKRISLHDIYVGSYPFLAIMLAVLALLVAFPFLSTMLVK